MRKFIHFENKEEAKGINVDSLRKSRFIRQGFIDKYGLIPSSILVHKRHKKSMDLIIDEMGGGYTHLTKKKHLEIKRKQDYIPGLEFSGFELQNRKRGKGGSLSTFSQNVGSLIVRFYCPEGGLVYDPFAGHNSRMELCFNCGRDYVGIDVSKEYMKANRKIREILLKRQQSSFQLLGSSTITLIEGSSDEVDLPDNYADFTITSPPYWDIEYYGDEPEQLGNAKTYEDFLSFLTKHAEENFRILKPDSFCAWFVNDFRKDRKFYPYHSDLLQIFCGIGFDPFNIYIVDLGNPFTTAFVGGIERSKIFPKQHEYCLLFKVKK